jgi:hypothetical protein
MREVTTGFVLVHAPVLGPGSWSMVAGELGRRGYEVTVPALTGFDDGGPPYVPRLLQRAGAQFPRRPADRTVLVVHSGAGVFAPYLADAAAAETVIFADSAPGDARMVSGDARVAEEGFLPFLREIASEGVVPAWPDWWPGEDLSSLYPDEATRRAVEAEARPLPLAFFEERLPPIPGSWRSRRCGFLRFSEGYAEPAKQAAALGWPVRELPGEHLHMLVDPPGVAAALAELT